MDEVSDENVTYAPGEFLDALDQAPYVPNEPTRRAMLRARLHIEQVEDPRPLF